MVEVASDSGRDRPVAASGGEEFIQEALRAGAEALSVCGCDRVSVADYAYSVGAFLEALPVGQSGFSRELRDTLSESGGTSWYAQSMPPASSGGLG